jgi:amidase
MARDVAGVAAGMALLEPGFAASPDPWSELRHGREGHGSGSASRGHATPAGAAEPGGPAAGEVVGRLRGLEVDPVVDAAVDAALQAVGLIGTDVELDGWMAAHEAGRVLMFHEGLRSNADWYPRHRAGLGADVVARFDTAAAYDPSVVSEAYGTRDRWQAELGAALQRVGLLVLAGYPSFPPRLDEADPSSSVAAVAASLAGVPALVLPIPVVPVAGSAVPRTADGRAFPASLQLVGPWGSEELLVAVGARIEAAVRAGRGPS